MRKISCTCLFSHKTSNASQAGERKKEGSKKIRKYQHFSSRGRAEVGPGLNWLMTDGNGGLQENSNEP
jgi:hypothetical protein